MSRFFLSAVGVLLGSLAAGSGSIRAEVSFERDIRPILAEKCTLCHGPDDAKGGLRLTGLEEATRNLKSGTRALVPGEPDSSELITRIHTRDPDEMMPPPDKADPLTDREKALLEQWIQEGADWPLHWAFAPLQDKAPPESENRKVSHPIDAFVQERLKAEGIAPSPLARPEIQVRRLYLDLLGQLPPLDVVQRFAEQPDDQAWARLVDQALASPHYGERWGRHWLDKARYADSDGYEKDRNRPNAWRYRDWVIDALNRDLPFDQFTIEQLAGDLLPNASADQRLATAFNRQTLTNTEGGTDKEQWRVAAVMDRTETLGSLWLGLTVSCARCHTHKYDPVTHKEYYQLFAYFNNGDETDTTVPKNREAWTAWKADHGDHQARIESLESAYRKALDDLGEAQRAWEADTRAALAAVPEYNPSNPGSALQALSEITPKGPKGVTFESLQDGSLLVGGTNPDTATYQLKGHLPAGRYTALRLDVLPHPSLGGKGPGRSDHGNFVLNDLRLIINGKERPLAGSRADFAQNGWAVEEALDGQAKSGRDGSGWAISPQMGRAHWAEFGFAEPLEVDGEPAAVTIELIQNYGSKHTLGHFRLSLLTQPSDLMLTEAQAAILRKPVEQRSQQGQRTLRDHFARLSPRTRDLREQIEELRAATPAPPEMKVRVISQRERDPRKTHVFRRGEFKEPEAEVQPGTFEVLPPITHRNGSDQAGDRLDLARWLVSGENPLPPRVITNQIWGHLFGEGLVATEGDFGIRGDRPSDPALLDWLSSEFIRLDWSQKALIRLIVTSHTYRQSSHHRPELASLDPKNRLLARQNRFRVEAETVRDLSLDAAGLLSRKIGGPSVFPPMPPGVADVNYNSAFKWQTSPGEDRYRRGLYTFFKRTAPHPNLMTFDCPDSNVTCIERTRSNTPLAALITLNNEVYIDAARGLGKRMRLRDEADRPALAWAFQLCLARPADADELEALEALLEDSRDYYGRHPEEAKALAATEEADPESAAWTATARILLNLDEFLTRD